MFILWDGGSTIYDMVIDIPLLINFRQSEQNIYATLWDENLSTEEKKGYCPSQIQYGDLTEVLLRNGLFCYVWRRVLIILSLLQHPPSPPVRKEYHQRFGRRLIYVVGDESPPVLARTGGDGGLSPPVIVEPAVMGGASPPVQKPLFRTGGDVYFPTKKIYSDINNTTFV